MSLNALTRIPTYRADVKEERKERKDGDLKSHVIKIPLPELTSPQVVSHAYIRYS